MSINSPLTKKLKEARLAIGLSQKQLGVKAGFDEFSASARMNQYETGKHVPDYGTLSRIAKVLKLPAAYFYADDSLAIIIKVYWQSSKERKNEIHKLLITEINNN